MSFRVFTRLFWVLSLLAVFCSFQGLCFAQSSGGGSPSASGGGSSSGGAPGSGDKEECTVGNGNITTISPTPVNPQNDYSLTNNQLKRPTTLCPSETRFVRP